jgi:predicted negative regulator of RcsB-dependent stress response
MLEAIKKFLPQNFNDSLALVVIIGVPVVLGFTVMPDVFQGTLAAAWLLVVQFYFRRKSGGD